MKDHQFDGFIRHGQGKVGMYYIVSAGLSNRNQDPFSPYTMLLEFSSTLIIANTRYPIYQFQSRDSRSGEMDLFMPFLLPLKCFTLPLSKAPILNYSPSSILSKSSVAATPPNPKCSPNNEPFIPNPSSRTRISYFRYALLDTPIIMIIKSSWCLIDYTISIRRGIA